jgi:hypothetical protein
LDVVFVQWAEPLATGPTWPEKKETEIVCRPCDVAVSVAANSASSAASVTDSFSASNDVGAGAVAPGEQANAAAQLATMNQMAPCFIPTSRMRSCAIAND